MKRIVLGAVLFLIGALHSQGGVIQDVTASAEEIQPGEKLVIAFRLSEPADATVTILDSDQRAVRTYALGKLEAGAHSVSWDARDGDGRVVAREAYAWTIRAKCAAGEEIWAPADLLSRPVEHIRQYRWDAPTRTLSYRTPAAMRTWVRIGINLGACLRVLVEGEPRPRGVIAESWDGMDETGAIDVQEQQSWGVSIFGYRLPQPCVIVSGVDQPLPKATDDRTFLARLRDAENTPAPPHWHRRRAFTLSDRLRPVLLIEQLDPVTFSARLEIPDELGEQSATALQNMLANRIRLKWFMDGHCASEDVDAALPALLTLRPGQRPEQGRHFITANVLTTLSSVVVASRWIE